VDLSDIDIDLSVQGPPLRPARSGGSLGLQDFADLDLALAPPPARRSGSSIRVMAVASLALLMSALAGWVAWREWPPAIAPQAQTAPDVYLPRDVVSQDTPMVPAPTPAPQSAEQPAAEAPVAVPSGPEPVATAGPNQPAPRVETSANPTSSVRPQPPVTPSTVPPTESRSSASPVLDSRPSAPAPTPTRGATESAESTPPRPVGSGAPAPRVEPPPAINTPPSPLPTADMATLPAPAAPAAPVEEKPAPPPAETVGARPTAAAERAAVRAALSRYETAYSNLDSNAATAVWPAVDRRALERAFDGLAAQRVTLDICEVGVTGQNARANCSGRATWTPKVGGGTQSQARKWTFDLRRTDNGWLIVKVDTR
jgi:hypothetical protein